MIGNSTARTYFLVAKRELGTAERTFWLRSFKSRPDSHPPARLSFQRSQGQADAGNHSIPRTLFLLGIRKIKAMDCCARTRREIAPAVKDHSISFQGNGKE